MFRDGTILYFAYIPDRINYLRIGRINVLYSTIDYVMLCIIHACNQSFLKRMSNHQIVYLHLYAYTDDDTVSTFEHLLN